MRLIGDRGGLMGMFTSQTYLAAMNPEAGRSTGRRTWRRSQRKSYQGPIGLAYFPTGATSDTLTPGPQGVSEGQSTWN